MNIDFNWLYHNIPPRSKLWNKIIGATVTFEDQPSLIISHIELVRKPKIVCTACGKSMSLDGFLGSRPKDVIFKQQNDNELEAFLSNAKQTEELKERLLLTERFNDLHLLDNELKKFISSAIETTDFKERLLLVERLNSLYQDAETGFQFILSELSTIIGLSDFNRISPPRQQVGKTDIHQSVLKKSKFVNLSSILANLSQELTFMQSIYETMLMIDKQANTASSKLQVIQQSAEGIRNIVSLNNNLRTDLLNKVNEIETKSINLIDTMWKHVESYILNYNKQSELFVRRLQDFAESSIKEIPESIWGAR